MNPKIISRARMLLFLGALAVIVWQQQQIKRLTREGSALREQSASMADLRDENRQLIQDLETATARSEKDLSELVRLRADAGRLRIASQENMRLKAERELLIKNATQPIVATPEPAREETPEVKFRRAYGGFGRDLVMALREAHDEDGRFPDNFTANVLSKSEGLRTDAELYNQHGLNAGQFERVYKGSWMDLKHPGETILVRQKQPVQLPDGKWMKVYGFVDGHSQLIAANSPDGFAAIEKERDYWPPTSN